MKRVIRGIVSFFLVTLLLFSSLNLSSLSLKAEGKLSLNVSKSNSWKSGGRYFAQFDLSINNKYSKTVSDWTIKIDKSGGEISQSWCCQLTDLGDSYELRPETYNKEIKSGENVSNIGLIMSFLDETNSLNASISPIYEASEEETKKVTEEVTVKTNTEKEESSSEKASEEASKEETIDEDLGMGALIGSQSILTYADATIVAIRAGYDNMLAFNSEESTDATITEETIAEAATEAAQLATEFVIGKDEEIVNNDSANSYEESITNESEIENTQPIISSAGNKTIPSGRIRVSGTKLVDASGNIVQLRGVSSHGLSWFPEYVNEAAMASLKADFGINVFRIAMYPREYAGYLSGGDKEALKAKIDEGVKAAANQGLYVIIDWHVLNYNPNEIRDEAISFFNEMSIKYAGYDNVIYEICNEPVGADWASQIKPYAESVIAAIRANDSNALVIVGTNTWSQDVDAVVGNEINDANVCYSLHFYAATHKEALQNKLRYAVNNGVPVFVSECSICDASGNGGIDYAWANSWLELLNSLDISYIAWSLSNKAESSALINSSSSKTSNWTYEEYSETGKWFMDAMTR